MEKTKIEQALNDTIVSVWLCNNCWKPLYSLNPNVEVYYFDITRKYLLIGRKKTYKVRYGKIIPTF